MLLGRGRGHDGSEPGTFLDAGLPRRGRHVYAELMSICFIRSVLNRSDRGEWSRDLGEGLCSNAKSGCP
jgi:hypothetical protein